MGGNYMFVDGPAAGPVQKLYWLDLTTTFAVDSFISNGTLGSVDVPTNLTSTMDQQVRSSGGGFFYDNTTIYTFSGFETNEFPGTNVLPAFNTSTNTWTTVAVGGGNLSYGNSTSTLTASVPESGLSFAMNGDLENIADGLIMLNTSDSNKLLWANITEDASHQATPRVSGCSMAYVPMGKQGVLLLIGGGDTSHVGTEFADWPWDEIPMDRISVYDIDSDKWYTVNATGQVPSGRGPNCYAVSRSPDSSSFQITIYGGWSLFEGRAYEDVYVLTVPSFRWIKIFDQNNVESQAGKTVGRHGSTCATWQDAQMIVLGGLVTEGPKVINNNTFCNATYTPIRVLDTSTYTWQSEFKPNASYKVHGNISSVIGGDSSGKATIKAPAGGWNSTELETIFSQTLPALDSNSNSTPTTFNGNLNSTASPTQTASQPPKTSGKPKSGMIAGVVVGVVGGVGGLVLIITMTMIRRKRKEKTQKGKTSGDGFSFSQSNWTKPELASDSSRVEMSGGNHGFFQTTELDGCTTNVHEFESAFIGHEAQVIER